MSTAFAIFVKTPSLSPVKTRLAATIGIEKAKEFYAYSLKAIEQTAKQINADIFWAVGEENGLNDPLWKSFKSIHTGEGGLGERQHHIYTSLLANHDKVLLIGADAPQISPCIINKAIETLSDHNFVIGPANDGGYYLFGGRIKIPKNTWKSVAWSTNTTRSDLENNLPSKPQYLEYLTDVDEQHDLQCFGAEMPNIMSDEQNKLMEWIATL